MNEMLTIYVHAFFALIAVPVGLYIFLTKKAQLPISL